LRSFAWQEGYGAFRIGISATDETVNYIRTQEEHHRHRTFQEEVELFLRKHGITFDSAMLED
jgi:hypothetical protein